MLGFLTLWGLALAGGLDFSVGVQGKGEVQFLSSLGLSFDFDPFWLRAGVRFGAPSGVLAEAGAAFWLPLPWIRPYLGGGAALGLTERDPEGGYRVAVGEVGYAVAFAGVTLPSRGYLPYLEYARYLGSPGFDRYTVGFVMEVY